MLRNSQEKGQFSDLVYSVVKAHAGRGMLLQRAAVESLAESKSLDDLVTRLKGTPYSEAVSGIQAVTAHNLEKAFRDRLALEHHSIEKVTPNPEILSSYYLGYVASNLKLILKGRALGKSYEELSPHVHLYPEELIGRREIVVRALSSNDLDEAVNSLEGTIFGDEAREALQLYRQKGRPEVFDLLIDRSLHSGIGKAYLKLKRGTGDEAARIEPMVASDIDGYNATSLLRAKLWGLSPTQARELMVEPIFNIPRNLLDQMASLERVDEALAILNRTRYRRMAEQGETDEATIAGLEEGFLDLGYRRALKSFLWDIFSVSLVLGYVKLLELEVRNLTAVAFGVESSLGFQAITSKLRLLR